MATPIVITPPPTPPTKPASTKADKKVVRKHKLEKSKKAK